MTNMIFETELFGENIKSHLDLTAKIRNICPHELRRGKQSKIQEGLIFRAALWNVLARTLSLEHLTRLSAAHFRIARNSATMNLIQSMGFLIKDP